MLLLFLCDSGDPFEASRVLGQECAPLEQAHMLLQTFLVSPFLHFFQESCFRNAMERVLNSGSCFSNALAWNRFNLLGR